MSASRRAEGRQAPKHPRWSASGGEGRACTAQPRGAGLAAGPEAAGSCLSRVAGLKTMSAAGGLCRRARLSRLVSFSASHRLHRWGVPTLSRTRAGLVPLCTPGRGRALRLEPTWGGRKRK